MIPFMLQWEIVGGYFMIFEEACRLKTGEVFSYEHALEKRIISYLIKYVLQLLNICCRYLLLNIAVLS
jgi:hypothetical protein